MAPSPPFGFDKDKQKLYELFNGCEDCSFDSFADCWQKMNFSFIFVGITTESGLKDFVTQVNVSLVGDISSAATKIKVKLAAFYTLYGVYYKQPGETKTCIRMTRSDIESIKEILSFGTENNLPEVDGIWNKLLKDEAIDFVHRTHPYGPFTMKKGLKKEQLMSRHVVSSDPVDIQELEKEYNQLKESIFNPQVASTEADVATHDVKEDIGTRRRRLKHRKM